MSGREEGIYNESREAMSREGDRMFRWLLLAQWVLAIVLALWVSPTSWAGARASVHFHVELAIGFGAVINALPIALITWRPGWWGTRHVVAVAQMLWSGVLVMITGGRIETHFHVFGSLAFLAVYRDWRVLMTATLVVVADHLARGLLWPDSVYGIANPEWWRVLEHSAWIVFEDVILVLTCARQTRDMVNNARRSAELLDAHARVEREVDDRTAELRESADRYRALVENTSAIPFEWDHRARRFVYIAPQAAERLGLTDPRLDTDWLFAGGAHPDDRARLAEAIERALATQSNRMQEVEYRLVAPGHRTLYLRVLISSGVGDRYLRGLILDATQQRQLELDLRQAQKLESVGRLAAGVAHEINTPVQYVGDSLHFVRDSMTDLLGALGAHRASTARLLAQDPDDAIAVAATTADRDTDLAWLVAEYPESLDRALSGLERVATIVHSMKVFAHPDQGLTSLDVNAAISSTLTIATSEYKYVADVETVLGALPHVHCFAGEINQVILNLVVNAAHAIADVQKSSGKRGRITITTAPDGDDILITVADTGCGIPEAIRERVFDPFFTTKDVGRGTGQGLAIARKVIVDLHGGTLTFTTAVGVGTTFQIRLPVTPAIARGREAA